MSYLHKTGIIGIDAIEDTLLAGLCTGDPILLIGAPGCGKTAFVERLAHLLGYKEEEIALYSSPTINFEDVVGLPMPVDAGDGSYNLRYARTETTIWDKKIVLWDELNRTKYDMQNQVLQAIRDRRCAGIKLDLHYIFAAMNELHEKGTKPLDRALADRFSLLITFPKFSQLKSMGEKLQVITNTTTQDAVMIGGSTNPNESSELQALLANAREEYKNMDCGIDKFVNSLVDELNKGKNIDISGRRAGMIYRNVRALFAIKKVKEGRKFNPRNAAQLNSLIYYSMPERVTSGEEFKIELIKAAVEASLDKLYDNNNPASKFLSMTNATEMLIAATKDKETSSDKELYSEVILSALNIARKEDIDNNSGSKEKGGMIEQAIATWILVNPNTVNKPTLERAVTTFNGLNETPVMIGGWTGNQLEIITRYLINGVYNTNEKITSSVFQANKTKFMNDDQFHDLNGDFDKLFVVEFFSSTSTLLTADASVAQGVVNHIKKIAQSLK